MKPSTQFYSRDFRVSEMNHGPKRPEMKTSNATTTPSERTPNFAGPAELGSTKKS